MLRTDWEVTIMPSGPKWCELILILYRTPFSTELNVNKADYPKLRHCCKTFGCFETSRRFMTVGQPIFTFNVCFFYRHHSHAVNNIAVFSSTSNYIEIGPDGGVYDRVVSKMVS